MIKKLRGLVDMRLPTGVVLDVNGVGYDVEMPLSALAEVPSIGSPLEVWTYTHVREDAIRLFGFLAYEDRLTFETLLSIGGLGPKTALAMLSTLSVRAIAQAVLEGTPETFESVPGVGARTAEKILVALKPKLKKLRAASTGSLPHPGATSRPFDAFWGSDDEAKARQSEALLDDMRSALENLGFKDKDIAQVAQRLKGKTDGYDLPRLMKEALIELNAARRGPKAQDDETAIF